MLINPIDSHSFTRRTDGALNRNDDGLMSEESQSERRHDHNYFRFIFVCVVIVVPLYNRVSSFYLYRKMSGAVILRVLVLS